MKWVSLLALFVTVLSVNASECLKSITTDPDFFSGKPSDTVKVTVNFECTPGTTCDGFDTKILRKDAPKEFFAIQGLPILKHRHPDYDSYVITAFRRFSKPLAKGQFVFDIPLKGYKEGDYAVAIVGAFTTKTGKRIYDGIGLCITVTESDPNPPPLPANFAPQFTVKAEPASPTAGTPVKFSGEFLYPEAKKVRLYSCYTLRSSAPKAFFVQEAARVQKHASKPELDRIELQGNTYVPTPTNRGKFEMTPEIKLPAGHYELIFQLYGLDNNKKSFYGSTVLKLDVK